MKFETLEDYDIELTSMKQTLAEMEDYIQEHPERLGYAGNYQTLKYVFEIYLQNRNEFIEELNEINLNLKGESLNNELTISELTELSKKFNETENYLTDYYTEDLIVKNISQGSYHIKFAFKNPTDDDVKRNSPRKKGLIKLFNFLNCKDNINDLKKEAGPHGKNALKKYKEFLEEIIKHDADFTLDTEKGSLKAGLTLQQCKNICENLNI